MPHRRPISHSTQRLWQGAHRVLWPTVLPESGIADPSVAAMTVVKFATVEKISRMIDDRVADGWTCGG